MFGTVKKEVVKGVCDSCSLHTEVEEVYLDSNLVGQACVDIEACKEASSYMEWDWGSDKA